METLIYILAGIGFMTVCLVLYFLIDIPIQYYKGRKTVRELYESINECERLLDDLDNIIIDDRGRRVDITRLGDSVEIHMHNTQSGEVEVFKSNVYGTQ